jgi:dTDP-D-glucose 4,6-dehydratase
MVMEKGENGQVYNIGGGNERKSIEIAKEILRCLSLPEAMIEFVPDRPGHDFRYSLSCDKIRGLGWKPQVGFEEGFQKTIDWYKATSGCGDASRGHLSLQQRLTRTLMVASSMISPALGSIFGRNAAAFQYFESKNAVSKFTAN